MTNLIGQTFGRLTVLSKATHRFKDKGQWLCQCECGAVKSISGSFLLTGKVRSCGCLRRNGNGACQPKHRASGTTEFNIWNQMRQRCHNTSHPYFGDYGGRGIAVCERWRDNFSAFYADMGSKPDGCTLERVDNSGNYELSNCRWATRTEQANNRRSSRFLSLNGVTKTCAQWSAHSGISQANIYARLRLGWSVEKVITTPTRHFSSPRRSPAASANHPEH